jgi:glucan 1,3-beta-glucosidase
MQRQGIAAFNQNPSTYKVFRNIKDYGAKGMRFAQGVIHTLLTGNLQVTE